MDFEPGALIGSYVIDAEIGRGGFGAVYSARSTETGAKVAIKVQKPRAVLRASRRRRPEEASAATDGFDQEISLLRRLDHPNVVRYIDAMQVEMADPSRPTKPGPPQRCVVLQMADLGSLRSMVSTMGRFREPLTAVVAACMLSGLNYIHEQGIVHRDIKDANILVTDDGSVLVTDFGIALSRSLEDAEDAGFAGTANYMPPEAFDGQVSAKSDVWSLGCTMIKLLSGRDPFHGVEYNRLLCQIAVEGRSPPLPSGLSEGCEEFLHRVFRPTDTDRASVSDLLSHSWLVQTVAAAERAVADAAGGREAVTRLLLSGFGSTMAAKTPSEGLHDARSVAMALLSRSQAAKLPKGFLDPAPPAGSAAAAAATDAPGPGTSFMERVARALPGMFRRALVVLRPFAGIVAVPVMAPALSPAEGKGKQSRGKLQGLRRGKGARQRARAASGVAGMTLPSGSSRRHRSLARDSMAAMGGRASAAGTSKEAPAPRKRAQLGLPSLAVPSPAGSDPTLPFGKMSSKVPGAKPLVVVDLEAAAASARNQLAVAVQSFSDSDEEGYPRGRAPGGQWSWGAAAGARQSLGGQLVKDVGSDAWDSEDSVDESREDHSDDDAVGRRHQSAAREAADELVRRLVHEVAAGSAALAQLPVDSALDMSSAEEGSGDESGAAASLHAAAMEAAEACGRLRSIIIESREVGEFIAQRHGVAPFVDSAALWTATYRAAARGVLPGRCLTKGMQSATAPLGGTLRLINELVFAASDPLQVLLPLAQLDALGAILETADPVFPSNVRWQTALLVRFCTEPQDPDSGAGNGHVGALRPVHLLMACRGAAAVAALLSPSLYSGAGTPVSQWDPDSEGTPLGERPSSFRAAVPPQRPNMAQLSPAAAAPKASEKASAPPRLTGGRVKDATAVSPARPFDPSSAAPLPEEAQVDFPSGSSGDESDGIEANHPRPGKKAAGKASPATSKAATAAKNKPPPMDAMQAFADSDSDEASADEDDEGEGEDRDSIGELQGGLNKSGNASSDDEIDHTALDSEDDDSDALTASDCSSSPESLPPGPAELAVREGACPLPGVLLPPSPWDDSGEHKHRHGRQVELMVPGWALHAGRSFPTMCHLLDVEHGCDRAAARVALTAASRILTARNPGSSGGRGASGADDLAATLAVHETLRAAVLKAGLASPLAGALADCTAFIAGLVTSAVFGPPTDAESQATDRRALAGNQQQQQVGGGAGTSGSSTREAPSPHASGRHSPGSRGRSTAASSRAAASAASARPIGDRMDAEQASSVGDFERFRRVAAATRSGWLPLLRAMPSTGPSSLGRQLSGASGTLDDVAALRPRKPATPGISIGPPPLVTHRSPATSSCEWPEAPSGLAVFGSLAATPASGPTRASPSSVQRSTVRTVQGAATSGQSGWSVPAAGSRSSVEERPSDGLPRSLTTDVVSIVMAGRSFRIMAKRASATGSSGPAYLNTLASARRGPLGSRPLPPIKLGPADAAAFCAGFAARLKGHLDSQAESRGGRTPAIGPEPDTPEAGIAIAIGAAAAAAWQLLQGESPPPHGLAADDEEDRIPLWLAPPLRPLRLELRGFDQEAVWAAAEPA